MNTSSRERGEIISKTSKYTRHIQFEEQEKPEKIINGDVDLKTKIQQLSDQIKIKLQENKTLDEEIRFYVN